MPRRPKNRRTPPELMDRDRPETLVDEPDAEARGDVPPGGDLTEILAQIDALRDRVMELLGAEGGPPGPEGPRA